MAVEKIVIWMDHSNAHLIEFTKGSKIGTMKRDFFSNSN